MGKDLKKIENDAYDLMVSETICLIRPEAVETRFEELRFLVLYNIEAAIRSESFTAEEKEMHVSGYLKAYHDVWSRIIIEKYRRKDNETNQSHAISKSN